MNLPALECYRTLPVTSRIHIVEQRPSYTTAGRSKYYISAFPVNILSSYDGRTNTLQRHMTVGRVNSSKSFLQPVCKSSASPNISNSTKQHSCVYTLHSECDTLICVCTVWKTSIQTHTSSGPLLLCKSQLVAHKRQRSHADSGWKS